MYFSFALAGHRGTCLRPLHIFALLCFFALYRGLCALLVTVYCSGLLTVVLCD